MPARLFSRLYHSFRSPLPVGRYAPKSIKSTLASPPGQSSESVGLHQAHSPSASSCAGCPASESTAIGGGAPRAVLRLRGCPAAAAGGGARAAVGHAWRGQNAHARAGGTLAAGTRRHPAVPQTGRPDRLAGPAAAGALLSLPTRGARGYDPGGSRAPLSTSGTGRPRSPRPNPSPACQAVQWHA